jgi:hypothetical protein
MVAPSVTIDSPERMNLLGLLLRGLLEEKLKVDRHARQVQRIEGDVQVVAGTMAVTLRFERERILILAGNSGKPRARIRGTMESLLQIVTRQRLVRPVLCGRVRLSGNPLWMLRLLPLLRLGREALGPHPAEARS